MSQIDWCARRISVLQVKTGRRVDLPMPEEVMLALLDYVKHDRPTGDDDHVFLRARAPFGPPRTPERSTTSWRTRSPEPVSR